MTGWIGMVVEGKAGIDGPTAAPLNPPLRVPVWFDDDYMRSQPKPPDQYKPTHSDVESVHREKGRLHTGSGGSSDRRNRGWLGVEDGEL